MKLYSTRSKLETVDFYTAVFQALPRDGGLYMPEHIPHLGSEFWQSLPEKSFSQIAYAVAKGFLGDELKDSLLKSLVEKAINFPAPLVSVGTGELGLAQQEVLELFHGPSLAFKDFGARFMAGAMNALLGDRKEKLIILVATSGDTGGAVASGFYGSEHIDVIILYPKGKVSNLQEAQLTTLGGNISALRVDGTFDDCQALVKQAFLDEDLRSLVNISSANSINISRLIPQSFYYIEAYKQWLAKGYSTDPVFCVPSGNFGNLTAGLLAQRMGMPVKHFVAATNANDTVTRYAQTGKYHPKPSVATLSNAMDVGAPSNFDRMQDLFGSTWNTFKSHIYAASFSDAQTEQEMKNRYAKQGYVLDPHTAVGTLALSKYQTEVENVPGIVLGTAHPAKFLPDVERVLEERIEVPEALSSLADKSRVYTDIDVSYDQLKEIVLRQWNTKT